MKTIYQCCQKGKDVNKTLSVVKYAKTEEEAIEYLENNGGGIYHNTLHNFKMEVESKEQGDKMFTPKEPKGYIRALSGIVEVGDYIWDFENETWRLVSKNSPYYKIPIPPHGAVIVAKSKTKITDSDLLDFLLANNLVFYTRVMTKDVWRYECGQERSDTKIGGWFQLWGFGDTKKDALKDAYIKKEGKHDKNSRCKQRR